MGTNTTLIRSQNTNTVSFKNRRSLQCNITLIETVKQSCYGLQGDEREEHKNCISDKTQRFGKLPHRGECEFSVTSILYVYHRNSKIKTNKIHLIFNHELFTFLSFKIKSLTNIFFHRPMVKKQTSPLCSLQSCCTSSNLQRFYRRFHCSRQKSFRR